MRCQLQKKDVTESQCNACNRYYIELGIRPFMVCVSDHVFTEQEALIIGDRIHCPVCKQPVYPESPTGGSVCCEHIPCSICDWQDNPDKCNLARDPEDARRTIIAATGVREFPVRDPDSGEIYYLKADEYSVIKHQISNQEALGVTDQDFKQMGKEVTTHLGKLKLMHKGRADQICGELQDAYNKILQTKYSRAKVEVSFTMTNNRPNVSITGANSVTAWMLHEVSQYVSV